MGIDYNNPFVNITVADQQANLPTSPTNIKLPTGTVTTPTVNNPVPTGLTTATPEVKISGLGVPLYTKDTSGSNTATFTLNTSQDNGKTELIPGFKGNTLSFPFNPNDLMFNYVLNKMSFDTYGGRVTQLLSVKIDQMTLQVDAGSRANLMAFYNAIKTLQAYQVQTSTAIKFTIPAPNPTETTGSSEGEYTSLGNLMLGTGLTFYVWIRSMDIGWDPTTVTYPFSMSLEVQDSSYSAYKSNNGYAAVTELIGNLNGLFNITASGIGYSALFTGMPPIGSKSGTASSLYGLAQINANGVIDPATQITNLGSTNPYGG